MGQKISNQTELLDIVGDEIVPVVGDKGNGLDNFIIRLSLIKSIITASDVGLGAVDNTSDADKPVSIAVSLALNLKANTIHNHSINDITNLASILSGKAQLVHTHSVNDIPDFATAVATIVQNTTTAGDVEVGALEW